MRAIFLFLVVLVLQTSCSQENVGKMPIGDFKQELLDNAILVDVRTPEEFNAGHLENANNINWFDPDFPEQWTKVKPFTSTARWVGVAPRHRKN